MSKVCKTCRTWEAYDFVGFKYVWSITHDTEEHTYDTLIITPGPRRKTIYMEHFLNKKPEMERIQAADKFCQQHNIEVPPKNPRLFDIDVSNVSPSL